MPGPLQRSYLLTFLRYLVSRKPNGVPINPLSHYDDNVPTLERDQFFKLERMKSVVFRKDYSSLESASPKVNDYLTRIKRVCDVKGLELLIVLIPEEMQVDASVRSELIASSAGAGGDLDFDLPNRQLDADLDRLGIHHRDLLKDFREAGRTQRPYKPLDTHWNIAGNRLAADLIRDELLRGETRFWPRLPRRLATMRS
jgi:hypothetical protein